MNSNSEVGHAKNVANLEKMIASCIGFGAAYQPSKISIQLSSLQNLLLESRSSMAMVTDRLNVYNLAKNDRIHIFEQLIPRTNQVLDTMMASDASDKTKEDARGIVRKIKGIRASKKVTAPAKNELVVVGAMDAPDADMTASNVENTNGTESRPRSSAQTSRDQRLEHFARLLALLQTEPAYMPNETELQIGSLQQFLETMRAAHSAFIVAEVELSNARIRRDALLYADKTGLCDVAKDVKFYVKGAFKRDSPQYKQISGLKFVKYKK